MLAREPETKTMLTALALALVLGQPPQSCPTCAGGGTNGGIWGGGPSEGATGWFPLTSPKGWDRIKNMFSGEILGLGAAKCPCPLGSPVPNGDLWAWCMHEDMGAAAPVSAPAPPPAPAGPTPPRVPDLPANTSPFELAPNPTAPVAPLP